MKNKKLIATLFILIYLALLLAFLYKMLSYLIFATGGLFMLIFVFIILLVLLIGVPILIWRMITR